MPGRPPIPAVQELLIEDAQSFDQTLDNWGVTMATRYAGRRALALEVATGSIDLLTLNAISTYTDLSTMLRALAPETVPWVADNMEIFAEDGHIHYYGSDPASELSWSWSSVRHPTILPESVLVAYTGRQVTDLIAHPMLSKEMTIVKASCNEDTGELTVEFEQPRWLFCSDSGRAWESRPATTVP